MLAEASFELGHARLELSQLLLLLAHEREQGLHEVTHGEGGQAALVSGYCRRWCGVVHVESMSAEGAVVKLVRFTGSRNGLSSEGFFRVIDIGVKHFGGGAPSAMMGVAKQPSAGELYAPPPRIIAMAANGVNLSARSQPAPGHRAGVVEPGHRVGPELWAYHCRRPTGLPARYQRAH